jgi:hypothetical protein
MTRAHCCSATCCGCPELLVCMHGTWQAVQMASLHSQIWGRALRPAVGAPAQDRPRPAVPGPKSCSPPVHMPGACSHGCSAPQRVQWRVGRGGGQLFAAATGVGRLARRAPARKRDAC